MAVEQEIQAAKSLGAASAPALHPDAGSAQATLAVEGMTCASCVARIAKKLTRLPGVAEASVNLATERASVAYDPTRVKVAQLISAVEAAGYSAAPVAERAARDQGHDQEARRWRELGRRRLTFGLGAALSALVLILAMVPPLMSFPTAQTHNYLLALLALPVWGIVGWTFHRGAFIN